MAKATPGSSGSLKVVLEDSKSRHLGMLAFGLVAGPLLLWKLGSIGQAIGVALLLMAVYQGARLLQALRHPPGTFRVEADTLSLPVGLSRDREVKISIDELQHAFFIRRAVPWTQAGPILVVEAQDKIYTYPRDWFASDSDQRRVANELNRRLGSRASA